MEYNKQATLTGLHHWTTSLTFHPVTKELHFATDGNFRDLVHIDSSGVLRKIDRYPYIAPTHGMAWSFKENQWLLSRGNSIRWQNGTSYYGGSGLEHHIWPKETNFGPWPLATHGSHGFHYVTVFSSRVGPEMYILSEQNYGMLVVNP